MKCIRSEETPSGVNRYRSEEAAYVCFWPYYSRIVIKFPGWVIHPITPTLRFEMIWSKSAWATILIVSSDIATCPSDHIGGEFSCNTTNSLEPNQHYPIQPSRQNNRELAMD